MDQVRLVVQVPDPVSRAGIHALLASAPDIAVVPAESADRAGVRLVCTDQFGPAALSLLRRAALTGRLPVVLVAGPISRTELPAVVECGVVAILPRPSVTAARLRHSVLTAAGGGGVLPSAMVGDLMKHIAWMRREVLLPQDRHPSGLSRREIDVLRLMADGLGTQEIAEALCYSERTVKNVISAVTGRLHLRNRSHAVAYALRAGLI